MVLTYLFLLLHFSAAANAGLGDCAATENLAKGLGPAYDQGPDLNSCYANTAADQLTQKMLKENLLKKHERIQPLALWALYTLDDGRIPNDSKGTVATMDGLYNSLDSLRANGQKMLCKESEFGSLTTSSYPLFSEAAAARTAKLDEQRQIPWEGPCRLTGPIQNRLSRQLHELRNAAYFLWWDTLQKTCHTEIPPIRWHWYWLDDRSPALKKNSAGALPPAESEILANEIDQALDHHSLAGIEYQAGFLLRDGQSFMHWSNVVERKPIGGKCYYRIRDSFGTSCDRYKNESLCQDGYIWVDRQELLNHTDAVTYLQ